MELLLADRSVGQLDNDVEMAEVAGVLLDQVEQHPFERGRLGTVPAGAGLPDGGQVVALDDAPSALPLIP